MKGMVSTKKDFSSINYFSPLLIDLLNLHSHSHLTCTLKSKNLNFNRYALFLERLYNLLFSFQSKIACFVRKRLFYHTPIRWTDLTVTGVSYLWLNLPNAYFRKPYFYNNSIRRFIIAINLMNLNLLSLEVTALEIPKYVAFRQNTKTWIIY